MKRDGMIWVWTWRKIRVVLPACSLALALIFTLGAPIAAAAADGDYAPGFSWSLNKDYTPGTVKNFTQGNPDDDELGNPAWSYEWIDARGLAQDAAWYQEDTEYLTWDSYQYNPDTWAATNHGTVNLGKWNVNFHYSDGGFGKVPLVRWTNPTEQSLTVIVSGSFTMTWWGLNVNPNWPTEPDYWDDYLVGSPSDIMFMLGREDASDGNRLELVFDRYSKPNPGETSCMPPNYGDCDHVDIPVDFEVEVAPGDSIFWTARPLDKINNLNRWITLNHGNVSFTIKAEPLPQEPAVIEETKFYAAEPAGAIRRLVSIDPETLAVEHVLDLYGHIGFRANALAFSPAGELFGWNNHRGQLFQIDLQTGIINHIGEPQVIKSISGMSFDGSGALYGVSGGNDELMSIDPLTSTLTTIAYLGVDAGHTGMAIDFITDQLYVVSGNGADKDMLLRVDKEVEAPFLAAEIVGPLGVLEGGVAVEFHPLTGELFAIRDSDFLMTVDMGSGEATPLGILAVDTTNMAAPWPSPPDPMEVDDDGDGYSELEGDCNDSNDMIFPGGVEIPGNWIDDDCNSATTDDFSVGIDIRPRAKKNNINLKSNGKVKVALLSDELFDATQADLATVTFAGAEALNKKWLKDVNNDGRIDLIFAFETSALQLTDDATQGCLSGATRAGTGFAGCDMVNIVQPVAKKKEEKSKKIRSSRGKRKR